MESYDCFLTCLLSIFTFFWIIVLIYHASILIAFLTLSNITFALIIILTLRENKYGY